MANRLAEDIRLIAGVNNLAGGIGAQTPKQPIKGGRGVAYFNPDGSIGSDSGTKGETIQPEDAVGENETNTEDSNTGDDITNEPVSDQGIVPAEDLFNGNMGIGDSFTGVNGLEDCATGQEYEVRGDGQFNPPEGWEDANTPPVDPLYDPSVYWVNNEGAFVTPALAHEAWVSYRETQQIQDPDFSYTYTGPTYVSAGIYTSHEDRYQASTDQHIGTGEQHDRQFCGVSHNAVCDLTADEIYGGWSEEQPAQLSWDAESSSFISNDHDQNVDSKYKTNNAGEVDLCDSSGNQYSVVPSKDGGLVFTDTTNNIFIVRDNNGKITAAGSGSNRDQYVAF